MATSLSERLGVCSWSLKAQSAADLVAAVQQCGLSNIQLALDPLVHDGAAWQDLRSRLDDAGLRLVSGMFGCAGEDYSTLDTIRETGGLMPDQHWPTNRAHAERALNVGLDLGITRISTHAGFIPHDTASPDHRKMLERLGEIADLYAAAGAELLLETGQESAADLTGFLDLLNRPNVGVNFDPANMILYAKGDPIEALSQLMPRVGQVHLKDADATETPGTWGSEKRLGDGQVDWPAFLGVLDEHGYDGYLVIEREAGASRIDDIRHAREVIERGGR